MQRAEEKLARTAVQLAGMPLGADGAAEDVVDLSAAAVAMMEARNLMQANVKAMQTAEDMIRHTLDILS
jgi:hypothetical protein